MSYLVLARKWRPQTFSDLIGQAPIARVLKNSIDQDKLAHAYVFSGPRGVGKTSTARILAKSLNCAEGPTHDPCGKCASCVGIADSSSVDVIEIDGASNNSVDNIRDLRERVKYAPSSSRFKVYIIDEAHMLSTSAFNALLKTLEEPPPHVIFVLATTEAKKIPLTVLSRCQHLPFRRVSTQDIRERLSMIVRSEGIKATEGALTLVARAADGSIRDSLTILDQVASFSTEIHDTDVKDLLGIADFKGLTDITMALLEGKRDEIIGAVAALTNRGTDLRAFTRDLIKFFRDLIVAKLTSGAEGMLDASAEEMGDISKIASGVSLEYLTLIIPELIKAESDVRVSFSPRIALEMALVRISYLSMYRPVSDALAALSEGFSYVSAASPASGGAPVASKAPPEEPSAVKEEPAEFQAPENPA
ncbi:MAG: DNA polymerase III subunit gamma/tau, partial [Thermodesulfovibrionales bacterium]|nr:DNA polymerase III subunit gamma/tau [Thermodesulfovibrionales bacterium]